MSRLLPLPLLLLVACAPAQKPEGPHFLWSTDVNSLDNPFPDARFLVDGGAVFRPDWYKPFIAPEARDRGALKVFFKDFAGKAATDWKAVGTFGPTLLTPSVPLDRTTLAGHVARVKKVGDGFEAIEKNVVVEHSYDPLEAVGREVPANFPNFILLRPSVAFHEGEEGFLVVLKGFKTADGAEFVRGREWEALTTKPNLEKIAAALGVGASDILLTLPQSGQRSRSIHESIAAWVDAHYTSTITIPPKATVDEYGNRPIGKWLSTDPDWDVVKGAWLEKFNYGRPSTAVGMAVFGSFTAKDLREDGVWKEAWVADPSLAPTVTLQFALTVPTGTKPAGGWPLLVIAHGINGQSIPIIGQSNAYVLEVAELFARKGFACIGIDAPSHGTRGNVVEFFAVENIPKIRENFREAGFDMMQLATMAPHIDLDGDGQGDFKKEVGFFGNSLGGIMGTPMVYFDKNVKTAALNVTGSGLSNILVSNTIRDEVGILIVAKSGLNFDTPEYYSAFPLFRAAAQPFLEQTDPVVLLGEFPGDRAVLLQEAAGDGTVPNFTSDYLGATMKLTFQDAGVTSATPLHVLVRMDPRSYLDKVTFDPHDSFNKVEALRTQVTRFIETAGTELVVPPPLH